MALVRFDKMHGLGNDFVIFDARENAVTLTADTARALADRHGGIGCDQIILLAPSDVADLSMRIFNPDGGEAGACGNASRCVVAREARDCRIETAGGLIEGRLSDAGITVDMGAPRFGWQDIPLAHAVDTDPLPIGWGTLSNGLCVNVGNPHIVFFVEDITAIDVAALGSQIETDPLFPERTNVEFARIGADGIDLVVWERGAGLTQACGTGACATAVAAIRRKLATGPVRVDLPGGSLVIDWRPGENVMMTGGATHVFSGEIDFDALTGAA